MTRDLELRAARILELAANSGLGIDDVYDPNVEAVRLAKRARDAVVRVGCASAVKLEAAAMLRDGWCPRSPAARGDRSRRSNDASRSFVLVSSPTTSGAPVAMDQLPVLFTPDDEAGATRVFTQSYDLSCRDLSRRRPFEALHEKATPEVGLGRHPITAGFCAGAEVDVIADSLACGDLWEVGLARDSSGSQVILLSEIEVPYGQQIAAWLVSHR